MSRVAAGAGIRRTWRAGIVATAALTATVAVYVGATLPPPSLALDQARPHPRRRRVPRPQRAVRRHGHS